MKKMNRSEIIAEILALKDAGVTDIQVTLPNGRTVFVADQNHEPTGLLSDFAGPEDELILQPRES